VHKGGLRLIPTPRLVDILVASLDKLGADEIVRHADVFALVARSIAADAREPTKQFAVRFGRPREIGLSFGAAERGKLAAALPGLCRLLEVDHPAVQQATTELIAALKDPAAKEAMGASLAAMSDPAKYRDLKRWETLRNLCEYASAFPSGEAADPLLAIARGLHRKVNFELATTGLLTVLMNALGRSAEVQPNEQVVAFMRDILADMSLGGAAGRHAEYWLDRLGASRLPA
jgi:hypothetical protein